MLWVQCVLIQQQPSAVWYAQSNWDQPQGGEVLPTTSDGSYLQPQPTTMWYTTPPQTTGGSTVQQTGGTAQQPTGGTAQAGPLPEKVGLHEQSSDNVTSIDWGTPPASSTHEAVTTDDSVVHLPQEDLPPEYDEIMNDDNFTEVRMIVLLCSLFIEK